LGRIVRKLVKGIWLDPVWSKVIASAIVAAATGVVAYRDALFIFLRAYVSQPIVIALFAALLLSALVVLTLWLRRGFLERRQAEPRPVLYIREDILGLLASQHMPYCFEVRDYKPEMKLRHLVVDLKQDHLQLKLDSLKFGHQWRLFSWDTRTELPSAQLDKTLAELGVRPNGVLEIYPFFLTIDEWKATPLAPNAVEYNVNQ